MNDLSFDGFEIPDNQEMEGESSDFVPSDLEPRDCPFTIIRDSLEQLPYLFQDVVGDFRGDYAPLRVKTVKKRMPVGDYGIVGFPGIAIERKSKEDFFGSMADNRKRENFIERLRKMQSTLEYGAVVVECYPKEIYEDPPGYCKLNPKTAFRSTISWSLQFPLIHWWFCFDRSWAEQTTFRILEKFYDHKTNTRYKHHNKPIDDHQEAFRLGILSRMSCRETVAGYSRENPLRLSWGKGWDWWSTIGFNGDHGKVWEIGDELPNYDDPKSKRDKKIIPLPNQTSFLDNNKELNGLDELVNEIEASTCKLRNKRKK
jgi:ERCC4-type nuclease